MYTQTKMFQTGAKQRTYRYIKTQENKTNVHIQPVVPERSTANCARYDAVLGNFDYGM